MFSIVIPTIWSPPIEFIDDMMSKLNNCDLVNEIIIINNSPDKYKSRYLYYVKVREFCFDNIYVNASWNFGVENSHEKYICLLNDDLIFNTNSFYFLLHSFEKSNDVKIVGLCKSSFTLENDANYHLEKIFIRNKGWGCFIVFRKEDYKPIPEDLRIHFGDDYLIKSFEGYVWKFSGMKVLSEISTSINSDPKFYEIIHQDNLNSLKYELPWSNDY